ncbi:MAG: hypothetical protein NT027_10470 [Proteobacteria bacterium]|nr:hypothetical protein [Pseudomonadota bacterium]
MSHWRKLARPPSQVKSPSAQTRVGLCQGSARGLGIAKKLRLLKATDAAHSTASLCTPTLPRKLWSGTILFKEISAKAQTEYASL